MAVVDRDSSSQEDSSEHRDMVTKSMKNSRGGRMIAAAEHVTELSLGWDAGASHTKIGFTLEMSRSDSDRPTSLIIDRCEGPKGTIV